VYFTEEILKHSKGDSVHGKTCIVSGAGNVAQYTVEKINALGGRVVAMSDSGGFIYDADGINAEKLAYIQELKYQHRSLEEYPTKFRAEYYKDKKLWGVKADFAFPCATQNEIDLEDAKLLIDNNIKGIFEGANMPTTIEAMRLILKKGLPYAPSKAANAGGVAISGLEMAQNSMRISWDRQEVDKRLQEIMRTIHQKCVDYGQTAQGVDYVKGANIAGFVKVADAMMAYGVN
jgi:glutamate dehydrogenase (NADP+)